MLGSTLRSEPRRRSRGRHRSKWTPHRLSGLRAWYDAELGQPKYSGVGAYVQLDGASTDNIFTLDSVATSFSNDIEVIMRVYVNDWTAAANQTLCGKYLTTGNQRSWRFYVTTTGTIGLTASVDGTAVTSIIVTPTTPFVDATWYWLRLRLDLTNGVNSVGTVEYAADTGDNTVVPTVWTANGSNTGATIASVFDSTGSLEIGSFTNGTLERLSGRVGRFILRSGFDGTTVADFNATDCYGDGYWHSGGYRWTLGLPKIYDRSGNNVAPATFGSGSNQPKWLPWAGRAQVYLPGVAANYVSAPDAAPLRITGDLELVARLGLADWSNGSQCVIARQASGTNRSYYLDVSSSGTLVLNLSADGSSASAPPSDNAVPFLDGQAGWVKATWRQSDGRVQYFTAPDAAVEPTSWTQLGTDKSILIAAIFAGTSPLEIGSRFGGALNVAGQLYRAIVRNGIGGTTVADFNAELCGQSGYTDSLGNVWTVNRSTSGRKTVVQSPVANSARSVILHGTDDWIVVPAAAVPALDVHASGTSVNTVARRWHNPGTNAHAVFTTKVDSAAATLGVTIRNALTAADPVIVVNLGDGTTNDTVAITGQLGAREVIAASTAPSDPFISAVVNGGTPATDTSRATTVTTSTGGAGRVGAYTSGSGAIDMEFEALVLRNAVTSDTEHGLQAAYYKGGV